MEDPVRLPRRRFVNWLALNFLALNLLVLNFLVQICAVIRTSPADAGGQRAGRRMSLLR